ncbi:acetolactate synthase small subunit [Thermicanus aegyptius]|uniref:acetolactate synthase small subunit n=1 Tax=Thermicanus aegyptius TaxID=94009 RepID=UPI0003F61A2C|nr:acetolactate synthase small subunit [Thermicanus aegyptius]MBE3554330.1 acetolactate synthase small subunit [Thermicanus sp.]
MKQILAILVNDHAGVLNRVTGLFLRRGYNIDSITVGRSERKGLSRMTIVLDVENPMRAEQVVKQLHKQIDILKVIDLTGRAAVERELAMIRVSSSLQNRGELYNIIQPFRATVIDVGRESITIEATGSSDKIEALIELLRPYGIKELARTGITAFTREMEPV